VPAHRQPGATPPEAVRDALSPVLEGLGLLVEDVTSSPAGNRTVLRVLVDAAEPTAPALSLDDVAEASRAVSDALDATDLMGSRPYVLEVSTPGVDRPLTEPRHFRRNLGRLVRVDLVQAADGGTVEGRLESAAESVVLQVAGPKKGMTSQRVLEWSDVARGHVQVEFSRSDEGS
jgi:ribosome maturation factor RimP